MAKVETLTAYKCKFSYLQRKNPLFEEQKDAIRAGENPEYSFSNFIETYQEYTHNLAIGENTDRAISLSCDKIKEMEEDAIKMWHLTPSAGKQGKPLTVVKKSGEKYGFGSDSAALYEYHIFVYERKEDLIVIFHRQNGSGCKSVFLETANKSIKEKGFKLEMDLIVPMRNEVLDIIPTKITLQCTKPIKSSDVADNLKGSKKRRVIKELVWNLEELENGKMLSIVKKVISGNVDQPEAFALMKKEFEDLDDYDDAELRVRVGSSHKTVKLNEFENFFGTRDISKKLHDAYKSSNDFVGELKKLADEYYKEIVESEEV